MAESVRIIPYQCWSCRQRTSIRIGQWTSQNICKMHDDKPEFDATCNEYDPWPIVFKEAVVDEVDEGVRPVPVPEPHVIWRDDDWLN